MKKIYILLMIAVTTASILIGCTKNTNNGGDGGRKIALGTDYETIKEKWGDPSDELISYKNGVGSLKFKDGYYTAVFNDAKLSNLTVAFEIEKGTGEGVEFDKGEEIAKSFLPSDAKVLEEPVEDLNPKRGKVVIYKTESLAAAFPKKRFEPSQPGICSINYQMNDNGEVIAITIALGEKF